MEEIIWTIIKWIITFILGSIVGIIGSKFKKEKEKNIKNLQKDKIIENAVQALLRDRLIEKYRHFKEKGEMTILDKENLDHLFESYEALEGNGTVKELYNNMDDIEIKVIKE